MVQVYYYVALLNAIVSAVVAVAVWRTNRYSRIGVLFGTTMLVVALWAAAFAQYFRSFDNRTELLWAQMTLTMAILNYPFLFHAVCELVQRARQFRWWIAGSYLSAAVFTALLWGGQLLEGIRYGIPYMDHYVRYDRAWYPWLMLYITFWQVLGASILVYFAYTSTGYKRTQFAYYAVTWLVIFLSFSLVILPIEYGINIPPVGFFALPFNFAFMAMVTSRARLVDFNVVIARVLMHTITLLVVVALSLLFIGGLTLVTPGFMDQSQMTFVVFVVMTIALVLTATLPRFLPRAERMMQERLLGGRLGYQDVLAGLVKELSRASTLDQMLETVATTIHSNMQVRRVLIFLQNPLTGEFRLQAQSGLNPESLTDGMTLTNRSPSVRWLREHKDSLVQDEVARVLPPAVWGGLAKEFDHFGVSLYVPMLLDERLVGVIALGQKLNREMFYVSDLRLLSTLATEVALGVRYRRMEEQVVRNNKLVGLGTIAAGLAHEIRNPLASIRTFAQLLPTKTDDPEFKGEFSKMVVQDVDRISKVIQSMLSFARPGTVNFANHSATDLIEEALMLVQPRLKNKSITVTRLFHEQPLLRVDKPQIIQVLLNVLNNAIDALGSEGEIRITTGVHRVEEAKGQSGQRFGVIEVSDNGPGIPVAVRSRLFDPFFTTKKDGTGLGLSISQRIIRDHNGLITVSSIEGRGTAFQVHLPLA